MAISLAVHNCAKNVCANIHGKNIKDLSRTVITGETFSFSCDIALVAVASAVCGSLLYPRHLRANRTGQCGHHVGADQCVWSGSWRCSSSKKPMLQAQRQILVKRSAVGEIGKTAASTNRWYSSDCELFECCYIDVSATSSA